MSSIKPTRTQKLIKVSTKVSRTNDKLSNPLNLFDEVNKQDKMWLAIAKDYLSRYRSPDYSV